MHSPMPMGMTVDDELYPGVIESFEKLAARFGGDGPIVAWPIEPFIFIGEVILRILGFV